jgi:hypothetical protein
MTHSSIKVLTKKKYTYILFKNKKYHTYDINSIYIYTVYIFIYYMQSETHYAYIIDILFYYLCIEVNNKFYSYLV